MTLSKPCYMIYNKTIGKVMSPINTQDGSFKCFYDTKEEAEKAIKLIVMWVEQSWVKCAELEVIKVTEVN